MARSHIKNAVAGAGKNANQGLSRMSKRDPETNLTGWALNVYRVVTRVHDFVLSLLTQATDAKKAIDTAKETVEKAREKKDAAIDEYNDNGDMASAQTMEYASKEFAKAQKAVTIAEDNHQAVTRAIRNVNGWLARFGAEVRKKVDHEDKAHPGVIIPGETHQERKERTKKALIGLSSYTTSKAQETTPLALPSIDVLALATGRDKKELSEQLCDKNGKPLFEGMPDELPAYFGELVTDATQKAELRDFLKKCGYGAESSPQVATAQG